MCGSYRSPLHSGIDLPTRTSTGKETVMKRLAACLLSVGLLFHGAAASYAAVAPAKPSLCFVTEWCGSEQEDVPLVAELRKAGFLIDNIGIQNLTPEKMRQYNVLIFPDFPAADPMVKPEEQNFVRVHPDLLKRLNPAVDEYVKQGGGVVVYAWASQGSMSAIHSINKLLEPWGAAQLHEQVWDPQRQYHYKQLFVHNYAWTDNLTKHPLTAGLKRVYYLLDGSRGPTTWTFNLSNDWIRLVCGDAAARSVPGNPTVDGSPNFFLDRKGTYDSAPPIIAVRDYGKGRIAVIGITPVVTVFGARYVGYGNVVMDVGDGNLGSDYGKLQERIYRWAAEPASKAGSPGGYVEKPQTPAHNPNLMAAPIDWTKFDSGAAGPMPFRGLIGACTQDGGGSGTVAQYVAAAGKAGLQFIGFTEDFTLLDAKKWEAFRRTCRDASTKRVMAIPGFLYRDKTDVRLGGGRRFCFPGKGKA